MHTKGEMMKRTPHKDKPDILMMVMISGHCNKHVIVWDVHRVVVVWDVYRVVHRVIEDVESVGVPPQLFLEYLPVQMPVVRTILCSRSTNNNRI